MNKLISTNDLANIILFNLKFICLFNDRLSEIL